MADRSDTVVIALEPSDGEDDGARVAALERLAALAHEINAALLVHIDARSERLSRQISGMLLRHDVAALPVVIISDPIAGNPLSEAAVAPKTMLATLASTCRLVEWDGSRCLAIDAAANVAFDHTRSALSAALGAPAQRVRVAWLRRRAATMSLPAGAFFAIDWPPYDAPPGSVMEDVDYASLAANLARRCAAEMPIAPSVLWTSSHSITLSRCATRVTGVSSIKIAHAIDSARRFVRNRAGQGAPFWVLRVALDPAMPADGAALLTLTAQLARAHSASGTIGRTSAPRKLPARSTARIAVVVHLYYPELWAELAAVITALPEVYDVYVSCPRRLRAAVSRMVHAHFPQAVVFGVSNLGRDVLPFLGWFRTAGVGRYEYVLKLHSKKSVHIIDSATSQFGVGDDWRRRAFGGLVGEKDHAEALLRALDARPDVGIVAPAGLLYDGLAWRRAIGDLIGSLCARLGLTDEVGVGFPAGTMFWARTAALAPLAITAGNVLDFEREAGQIDGTLSHAYERVFPIVAAACGYRTVDSAELLT